MDFHFANNQPLTWSGPAEKAKGNVAAIQLARQLVAESRPANPEELTSLSRYVGWGHTEVLNYALDKLDLLKLLTEDEWDAVKASTLNAHYTALPVIAAIWRGFERLGAGKLDSLNVLDPSAGVGHFKSMMPESLRDKASWVEVELDKITAQILTALHPKSKVFGAGYEDVNLPRGHFDIITSNVPFGNYPVAFDGLPRHMRTSIHDFFFARSLELLRPGGVMAFITSRYTLDKKDDLVRKHLAEHCDLLAAVRLPNNAFTSNAGTEVVTDLLFLRKRFAPNKEQPAWANVRQQTLQHHERDWAAEKFWVNQYYLNHPECVLGKPAAAGTMYRNYEYTVLPDERDLGQAITARLEAFLAEDLLTIEAPKAEQATVLEIQAETIESAPAPEPARVTAMREIYTTARQLLKDEANAQPASVLRHKLNNLYDDFVARYGFLNDPANTRPLKGEPELLFLKALEVEGMGTWLKADMFSKTTVRQANPLEQTDDPNDALLLCLDKLGRVDIPTIAQITGSPEEDAIRHLAGGRIFRDPETKEWLTDEVYLSGNVAAKLEAAEAAAMFDEQYQINVTALRMVQPEPLKAEDIYIQLGTGWLPEKVIEDFLCGLLETEKVSVTHVPGTAEWSVKIGYGVPSGVRSRWSTSRVDMDVIIYDTMNARQTVVYDTYEENGKEKRVQNHAATVAAQARQAELKAAFDNWVWMDVERTEHLVSLYNKSFNVWRQPKPDGSHLTFPGLNTDISLRKNQRNGAWRILQYQTSLLWHQVGAGKTLTAIVAAMEARRLGLARKVMAVVPNQVIGQWENEVLRAYPSARTLTVLAGDLSKSKRGTFLSRIATGDWDLVLVPYSVFKLLPMSVEAEIDFIEGQVAELEKYLWELKAQSDKKESAAAAIKSIERSKRAFEARLFEKKRMAKDSPDTITYEMLGVDMLVVDEFHAYKNLFFKTRINRIAGLPNSESQRAFDMYMKTRWSIQRGGKVVALTGTPVSNTLAEAYTMQRYMQERVLIEMGLAHFDAWAYQYAIAEPGVEMTPDGSGFRMNTRFRRFKNLRDLFAVYFQFTDAYAIQEGDIPDMPKKFAGGLIKVKCQRDLRLRDYVRSLGTRAEAIRSGGVKSSEDNMLVISSDGRKCALDVSLVLASNPNGPMPKVDRLVETVAAIHRMSTPMRGAQLVFCDLATPKAKQARKDDATGDDAEALTGDELALTTDIYAQIKRRLARRGIPEAEIAFAHDAKTTEQKNALFKAVNEGRKRVVIASSEKMGVGVNVHERMLAIHHLTPTWKPDGLIQRTGRMERPGNRYGEVFEFVYVTPGSFDGFSWQTLETKLGFIKDLERGIVQRDADDIGDEVASYAAIKAIASGNPLMLKKVELDAALIRLDALRAEWLRTRSGHVRDKAFIESRIPQVEAEIRTLEGSIAQREATGKDFSATINGTTYTERESAGKALRKAALVPRDLTVLGEYRGVKLAGFTQRKTRGTFVEVETAIGFMLPNDELLLANVESTDKGLFISLDAALRALDKKLADARSHLARLHTDLASLEVEIPKTWQHEREYEETQAALAALTVELDAWTRKQAEKKDGEDDDIDLSIVDNDDGWIDIFESALARINAIHQQPIEVELPEPAIPVTPEVIEQARQEVTRSQAQLDFMQAVSQASWQSSRELATVSHDSSDVMQASMFGDAVPAHLLHKKGGKRKR